MHCESQLEAFMQEYLRQLEAAMARFPRIYSERTPTVRASLQNHTFYKDRPAIRNTCAALGIPHTYEAIYAFVEGNDVHVPGESTGLEAFSREEL